ncbi:extracellular solute-binding protein [Arthrobacter sp. StoSoilB5]|uniref:ABC transporter substrate-binding protein n=1 Tax=Arthrobacter sp. StoSoilB5 TaxID=2830992 RepID=UPI001CC6BF5D|nr:extracellular solute-binding protein [Arthrobacter sp. StoSoilB5]BCW44945.1 sugar ABC transporter substrate-binding protein [Arthrobacter sp. StoSoilB5]
MRTRLKKPSAAIAATIAIFALALTGCAGSPQAGKVGTVEDPVTIRFAWWGNDARAKTTQEVIKDFEAANPTIKVQGENTEFSSYWDKMATQIAGGTTPDVFAMSGAYPSEYASRGVLLDLGKVKEQIDTSKMPEQAVSLGKIDGKQYTITAGVNAISMVVDPNVFEAAGVQLPDDDTWTWDDYVKIAADISKKSPAGTFGATQAANDSVLSVWARQHGEQLYSDDGKKLGISEDTATSFFELNKKLMESGGGPSASQTVEDGSAQPEATLMGQGKQAMRISWSSQIGSYSATAPLKMMKLPGEGKQPGTWLRSSMEYAISSKSAHPKEAALFINYLVNNLDAAKKIKSDRGMPANTELKAAITPLLKETQQKEAAYLDRLAEMNVEPPLPLPAGSSATQEVLNRYNTDVLFGKASPRDAARGFIQEVNQNLG